MRCYSRDMTYRGVGPRETATFEAVFRAGRRHESSNATVGTALGHLGDTHNTHRIRHPSLIRLQSSHVLKHRRALGLIGAERIAIPHGRTEEDASGRDARVVAHRAGGEVEVES